jgi:hypothetical protein
VSSYLDLNFWSTHTVPTKGYVEPRAPYFYTLPTIIENAIQAFPKLSRVTFTPAAYQGNLFVRSLEALKESTNLHELAVNSACMGETATPLLAKIEGIHKLTLHGPDRSILNILPDWLGRISRTLTGLHLKVSDYIPVIFKFR